MEPRVFEGKWNCKQCGNVGNRGPADFCPACGAAKPEEVEYYLLDEVEAVTNSAQLAEASAGPDWSCTYCKGANKAGYKFCDSCGAGSDKPKLPASNTPVVRQVIPQRSWQPKATKASSSKFGLLFLLVGLFLLCFAVYKLLVMHPTTLTVTSVEWKREVLIEKFVTSKDAGWNTPSGARITGSRRKLYSAAVPEKVTFENEFDGTEEYVCGKENLKNGYFRDKICTKSKYKRVRHVTEAKPAVFRTWYEYEVDGWEYARTETATGNFSQPITWPALSFGRKERESSRHEIYFIQLIDKKTQKEYVFPVNSAEWKRFKPGQEHVAKVNSIGSVRLVDLK